MRLSQPSLPANHPAISRASRAEASRGHLAGFSVDEIPEMLLSGTLVAPAGSGVAMTGLHMGYGPNRELFELRFPRTTGAVTVQLTGSVTSQPHDATSAASHGSKLAGIPAEWSVALSE